MIIEVALALVQRESDGRWLISQRASGKIFAGLWEFPGGKIEEGESPSAAAVREAWEEVGLLVVPVACLGYLEDSSGGAPVRLHLIRCAAEGGEPRKCDPAIADVRWASSAELRQLDMPPANARIIEILANLNEGQA